MPTTPPRYHKLATDDVSSRVVVVGGGGSWSSSSLLGGAFGHRRTAAGSSTTTTTSTRTADDDDATTVTVTSSDGDANGGGGVGTTDATTAGATALESAMGKKTDENNNNNNAASSSTSTSMSTERLWSNLNVTNQGNFRHEPGSLPGAIALVAGTTVGAGMLALPTVCQDSGFVPSTVALTGCWGYMVATGLLLLEVNLTTMCELGSGGVSIISMAERTLGPPGTRFAWGAYVFIHYALLVAYVSRAGEIIHDATGGVVPTAAASVAYAATLGGFMYVAPSDKLEGFNNALVTAVLATFLPLLLIAGGAVEPSNLVDHGSWSAVPNSIPVIALAFVFHNVIPVVSSTLEGDKRKIQTALIAGTAIPFAMFVLWNAAVLGSVSADDAARIAASVTAGESVPDPLETLRDTSAAASALVQGFSFFAISTSFLGFILGLTDFLADGLQIPAGDKNDPRPFALTLIPPTLFAISYPDVFLSALDSAGTFGVLTLFGCMPPLMAWSNRYGPLGVTRSEYFNGSSGGEGMKLEPTLPGGKPMLVAIFAFAAAVIAGETAENVTTALGN